MTPDGTPKAAVWFLQNLLLIHIRGDENDGQFSLVEFWGPPGDQPPPHIHHGQDEGFYVTHGEVTVFLPDREVVLAPGQFFNAPRGVAHTFRVTSDVEARWLITSVPAGVDAFVEEFGRPAEELRLPDPEAPDVERLVATAKKHDIDIVGPPGMLPSDLPSS